MVVNPEIVESTTRSKTMHWISAILISLGVLFDYNVMIMGITIAILIACIRIYVNLELYAISKCIVEIPRILAFEGDVVEVDISIKNPTLIPVFFAEVSIAHSPYLRQVKGVKSALLIIPAKNTARIKMYFQARIGLHEVGPLKLFIRDLFALYRFNYEVDVKGYVRVFPRTPDAKIRRLLVYTKSTGLTRTRKPGSGIELHSVREMREGDDVRRIVWKYLASKQRFIVKELEHETMNRVVFLVDATLESLRGPYGYTPFEHCARIVSSIARYLSHRGDMMYLSVYSDNGLYHTGKFVKGMRGFHKILSVLSSIVYPNPGNSDSARRVAMLLGAFEKLLKTLTREKTLILIFTTRGEESYEKTLINVIEKLLVLKHDVFVVIPLTTGFEVKGIPEWGTMIYRVKTYEITMRELEFAKKLRSKGIKTVAITADHIPQLVINLIETKYGY